MKTARLMILALNLALLCGTIFFGLRYYTHFMDPGSGGNPLDEPKLELVERPQRLIPAKPVTAAQDSLEQYRDALEGLARRQIPVEAPPAAEEQKVASLEVEVSGVVYDRENPANSGAHIVARAVPRYFTVGDDQLISGDMPYKLKEIREDKAEREYTLVFEDEKGKQVQARYVRK